METIEKIYIVTQGDYSDYHIVKFFLNKEDADFYAKKLDCNVEEHNLFNTSIETRPYWKTYVHVNEGIYYSKRKQIFSSFEEVEQEKRSEVELNESCWNMEEFNKISEEYKGFFIIATITSYISEEHCIKLAVEIYQKWLRRDV